jgi:hypothetical protein
LELPLAVLFAVVSEVLLALLISELLLALLISELLLALLIAERLLAPLLSELLLPELRLDELEVPVLVLVDAEPPGGTKNESPASLTQ